MIIRKPETWSYRSCK